MSKAKKKAFVGKECVACGSCVNECPLRALSIFKGITAVIDQEKCVGCGKCRIACPAGVIDIIEREEEVA